jgi:hypothetical protein
VKGEMAEDRRGLAAIPCRGIFFCIFGLRKGGERSFVMCDVFLFCLFVDAIPLPETTQHGDTGVIS